jgi:hypothetical protein
MAMGSSRRGNFGKALVHRQLGSERFEMLEYELDRISAVSKHENRLLDFQRA